MLKKFMVLFFIIFTANSIAQEIEDYIKKIDIKLRKDTKYLNLNYVPFSPDTANYKELNSIPRTEGREPFQFKYDDDISYRIVFLKEGINMDSIYLLYLDEIDLNIDAGERFFTTDGIDKADTALALNFRDIYALKKDHRIFYDGLMNIVEQYIKDNPDAELPSLLGINPDREFKTGLGMSARDNSDYLFFARTNEIHWFPKDEKINTSVRRRTAEKTPFRMDLSFSHLSLSHEIMDFSIGSTSLEVGVEEKVLNLLPWESMSVTAGFRTLFKLGEGSDLNNLTYIDARVGARLKTNTINLFDRQPYILSEKPLLNIVSSVVTNINITRPFSLPFLNIYFASGKRNFDNPFSVIENSNYKEAYFSFTQLEFTTSFYWNASDKKISRFKIDLGFGYYDVWRTVYSLSDSLLLQQKVQWKNIPVVALHYNFVPSGDPIFGGMCRFFDSRIKLLLWIRLMEISDNDVLRFETTLISSPIMRKQRDWENEGGTMFQLRYRHGL